MSGVTAEQFGELKAQFRTIDKDGNGFIDVSELKAALEVAGFKIPQYKVRVMVDEMDANRDGRLSYEEFEALCKKLKSTDIASTFRPTISKRQDLLTHGGMSVASSEGTTHSVRLEEQAAFSNWINSNLGRDPDCKNLLPLDEDGTQLYEKIANGILLCKLINLACPETIDERAINKKNLNIYTRHENLTLAVNSAESIGCNIVNIDADDLSKGKPHLVLGLLWQIIRIGLFNQITLEQCPGMIQLLREGEKIEDLMRLAPEQILLRWVNYHLEAAGVERRMNNFTSDVKDSEIYTYLLNQLAKNGEANLSPLQERDMMRRAEKMLQIADRLKCRSFVSARDVVEGIYKLNVAFVANLFNTHPGLALPEEPPQELKEILSQVEESREEKTYRNWMNSLGCDPFVNHLYNDLADGLIIFQLYDIIKPGIVNWKKVVRKFNRLRAFIEKVENCNYAVLLGKQLNFSLVGIAGQDISQGNPTLTMALIWQLMRAYTLSVLTTLAGGTSPIAEKEIITWVNNKLKSSNKSSRINSFQDPSLSNAMPVIDLIDAIKPGSIKYDQVLEKAGARDDRLANAKYAISIARKCGARIYALPEDIVECKPKLVMTVFACLMGLDYKPSMNLKPQQTLVETPTSTSVTPTKNNLKAVSMTNGSSSSSKISAATTPTKTFDAVNSNTPTNINLPTATAPLAKHDDDLSSTRDSLSPEDDLNNNNAVISSSSTTKTTNSASGDGGYDSVVGGSAASVDGEISSSQSSAASSTGGDDNNNNIESIHNREKSSAISGNNNSKSGSGGGIAATNSSSTLSTHDFNDGDLNSAVVSDIDGNNDADAESIDNFDDDKPVGVFGNMHDAENDADYAEHKRVVAAAVAKHQAPMPPTTAAAMAVVLSNKSSITTTTNGNAHDDDHHDDHHNHHHSRGNSANSGDSREAWAETKEDDSVPPMRQ